MHSSHEFRSLKAKIRVLCKQRRIRLEEFMKTFDVHHVKKIKAEQFKRALDVSGLHLSPTEVNLLLAKYRFPDEPLFVDYRRFCDLIDKVFTVKGLEGNPELKTRIQNEMPSLKKFGAVSLSENELELLKLVKAKLFAAVTNKGIVLKDVFHDFDRSNAGKVTKPQFVRDLLDIVYLTKEEMDVLLKAYGDELDVHYRALHFDICPGAAGAGTTVAAPRSPDRQRYTAPAAFEPGSTDADAVQELEAELSELAFRDRIRTKNFFTDFDSLRTGKCSEAQFKRCVKLCFGSLTENNLDLLVKKYVIKGLDCNKVDYIRFCNYVEGKSNRESNNDSNNYDDILSSIVASTMTTSTVKCSREARGSLSDAEAEIHQIMIQRIGSFCATRRVLLKPSFQDFDKGRREHITIEQFFRVMTIFKLTLTNDTEKRVLLKRYASAHGDRFVNYVTFCYDLEHWKAESTNQSRPSSRGNVVSEIISPTKIKPCTFEEVESEMHTRSVPMLLRYIKQIVKRDRIRLEEYYRDFDKLRHGNVTATQFCAGLRTAGLILSKDEMKLLGDEYACRELVDSAGQHFIAWKRFVDDVEGVFTVKGLERVPNHDLSVLVTRGDQFGGVKEEKEVTSDEERRVTQVVITMKRAIDRQRLSIKPAFEDFDRAKQGFISATKFERVLSMFSLLPADGAQTRLLVLKFRELIANGTTNVTLSSICDVNYRAFLQALDIIGATPEAERSTLLLPGSVAYRQELFNAGAIKTENAAGIRQMRDLHTSLMIDVSPLIAEIRRQLNARRVRIKEFVTEGDKLRSGEITVAKFHTALNRSGCVLDAADVNTLSTHFLSNKNSDKIDWRAFLDAIEQVGQSSVVNGEPKGITSSTDSDMDDSMRRILARLRLEVNHRRLHMKPYFQDYDHNKISRVTKFQYAAVLDMMKLKLAPHEVQALCDRFTVRDGRKVTNDLNYLAFIHAVDSDYS
uniref:Uncharacterized protein n=1 Tax=Globisporangium ultimum (strain ATCC 200006 / CBS 805.95 / DAOM BR144) TaxID=431595 RepID=K3W5D1_GLOUD